MKRLKKKFTPVNRQDLMRFKEFLNPGLYKYICFLGIFIELMQGPVGRFGVLFAELCAKGGDKGNWRGKGIHERGNAHGDHKCYFRKRNYRRQVGIGQADHMGPRFCRQLAHLKGCPWIAGKCDDKYQRFGG